MSVTLDTSHAEISAENALALLNIYAMSVTRETSHPVRSPVARSDSPYTSVTFATVVFTKLELVTFISSSVTFTLNVTALLNMYDMDVTLDTSQVDRFALNMTALLNM